MSLTQIAYKENKVHMSDSQQVRGIVINSADTDMIITGASLSRGKWIHSPVDALAQSSSTLTCIDRSSYSSCTEGWVTWKIGDAIIKITFDSSSNGPNCQSITCTPKGAYKVSCLSRVGSLKRYTFSVMPA